MARIRSVKPEFFGSEPVGNCSPTSRLLFIALWCMADDDGRAVDNPKIIRAFAFPLDDDMLSTDVDRMLAELHAARLIVRYEYEGRKYLAVRNFREHQHPKKRLASKLPSPEMGVEFPTSSPPVPHQCPTGTPCSGSGSGRVEGEGVNLATQGAAFAAPAPLLLLPEAAPLPKPPKAKKAPRDDGAGETGKPNFPHFPMPLCLEMHALWVSKFGAVSVPAFRKEFGPLFTIAEADRPAMAPTNAELRDALKSYVELAPMGDGAAFATVRRAAAVLSAIANTRREYSQEPERRLDAIMRIIHGRNGRAAA